MWPELLFSEGVYCKQDYSNPHNFKILRIKINEKLGFEITLKGANT